MRDLNSRVTEEHSRARVRDRHQLVDCDRLLGASQSAGSPRDWNMSSAYLRPASKLNRSKMSKTKMSQYFFPGSRPGVIGPFFAATGGVKIFLFLRGPLLRRQIRRRSSFFCFYRGMKRSRSGSSSSTNKLPQNHFEPPLKGEEYPPYLMRGEY